jgi:hypothetical protein
MRVRMSSRFSVGIRFGAAHRMYFDTPPLIGCWRGTCVPRGELVVFGVDREKRVPEKEPAFTRGNGEGQEREER